jgi:hypothetical protein
MKNKMKKQVTDKEKQVMKNIVMKNIVKIQIYTKLPMIRHMKKVINIHMIQI